MNKPTSLVLAVSVLALNATACALNSGVAISDARASDAHAAEAHAGEAWAAKPQAPIQVRVDYSKTHTLHKPLKVQVDAWSEHENLESLGFAVRILEDDPDTGGISWKSGQKSRDFAGVITRGDRRSISFEIVPVREGDFFLAVDVKVVTASGEKFEKTVPVLVRGGGALAGLEPAGAKRGSAVIEKSRRAPHR